MKVARSILFSPAFLFIRLGFGLSAIFLTAYILIEVIFFREKSLEAQIFAPTAKEIYIRLSIVSISILISIYTQYITRRLQINQTRLEQELTEHKRVEAALVESEEKYRQLVDKSPYGITIHQDGKAMFVNQAAIKNLRASSPDEIIGQPISRFIHPDKREAALNRIQRFMKGETGLYPTESHFVRLDGSEFPVQVTAAPFIFNGRPAIQMFALDMTDRIRTEEALSAAEANYRSIFENALGSFNQPRPGVFSGSTGHWPQFMDTNLPKKC